MQLNDLIEEQSVKAISNKTNISEENIERLIQRNFEGLSRVKALGFISILEREYRADLSKLREEAVAYYDEHGEDGSVMLSRPEIEKKRSKSKLLPLIILALLAYASWYFFTQFDRKHLAEYLPFGEHNKSEAQEVAIEEPAPSLTIEKSLAEAKEEKSTAGAPADHATEVSDQQPADTEVNVTQSSIVPAVQNDMPETATAETMPQTDAAALEQIVIVPVSKLWFGLVDMDTKERKHYTVSDRFDIDVRNRRWLVATSSAPFTIEAGEVSRSFNDAREHYLKLDKEGVEVLTKQEYIALGGYPRW